MLVEHKKCNASSRNPQAAALKALLAVSVAQNSECIGLGIPRWHCVQGAAGTGECCSERRIQAACSVKTHEPNRTLQKCPEQLPTGLSFCTKVDGFDPSERVVGLKGSQRLQFPVQPPVAAGRALS